MSGGNILKWASHNGSFQRQVSTFRNDISSSSEQFKPAAGRYHLYVSYACPWAHRTLIVRNLKGLQDAIGVSVVDYLMGESGWKFSSPQETPGCIPDPYYHSQYLRDLYLRADPGYTGRFTVPVLWDTQTHTIVNNESSDIIRILNSEFNNFATNPALDLYPEAFRTQIDETNVWVYDQLNNGVYKAGFATAQTPYEENAQKVHQGLVKVEQVLAHSSFIIPGAPFTEADIRLYTTILRFDPVYFGHFKCNLLAVANCPNTLRWLRQISALPGVKETINMVHIKRHYYMSHKQINPTQVVPLSDGPELFPK